MNIDEGLQWEGWDSTRPADITMEGITHEYGKTVGCFFKAGRDYSRDFSTDAMSFFINETAASIMNLGNPIGKTLRWLGGKFTIIGVVKDMVMESPYTPTLPTVYYIAPWWTPVVNIRLKPGSAAGDALGRIESVFKKYDATEPFNFKFADSEYELKFRAEQRFSVLQGFFVAWLFLSVAWACSDLSLSSRSKGPKRSASEKFLEFSSLAYGVCYPGNFSCWWFFQNASPCRQGIFLCIAGCKIIPTGPEISWWILLAAGAGALIITLMTVSFQAIKSAMANPVKALRSP